MSKNIARNTQYEKFKEAARELGCDESEDATDALMKRVAKSPPPRKHEKQKPKKPAT